MTKFYKPTFVKEIEELSLNIVSSIAFLLVYYKMNECIFNDKKFKKLQKKELFFAFFIFGI